AARREGMHLGLRHHEHPGDARQERGRLLTEVLDRLVVHAQLLGDQMDEVPVEHRPAEPCAERAGELAAAGAELAAHGDELDGKHLDDSSAHRRSIYLLRGMLWAGYGPVNRATPRGPSARL